MDGIWAGVDCIIHTNINLETKEKKSYFNKNCLKQIEMRFNEEGICKVSVYHVH